jgi:hypothetical protein
MKIEILENEEKLDLDNVLLKERFADDVRNKQEQISNIEIDFSSIQKLNGDKMLLELAFEHEKKEILI